MKQEKNKNITEISERIKVVLKLLGITPNSFAKTLGYQRSQAIYDMLAGKAKPSFDFFNRFAISEYSEIVSLEWLLAGKGSITKTKTTEKVIKRNDDLNDDLFDDIPKLRKRSSKEREGEEKTKTTEKVVKHNDHQDDHQNDHIPELQKKWSNELPKIALQSPTSDTLLLVPIVDVSAAAGRGFLNTDYIDQTNIISLPRQLFKKKTGQRYCIKIVGHSMYPTLAPGSYIIIRHLDRGEWGYIKDDRIYVITDTEGKTVVKRVLNDLYDCGQLRCISDNPDKAQYFDFAIPENEISNVFEVELYFTSDLNANMAVKQMTDQAEMAEMKMSIQELQKAIIEIRKKL